MICVLCHQLLESYKGLCIYANVLCIIGNHIGVLFSVYIRYNQRLYTIQVKKCSQKVEDTHIEFFY